MLNGALWVCWQGAADGMVVLFMRPRTSAGLEPLFVCIFFRVLLANPARVREFQRGIRDCCGRGPMGRVFKGIQNHTGMKSLLWKSMTNGKSHQTLCLPHNCSFSSKGISRICRGNPDQDNCVLFVKGKPKITLNLGKTFCNCSQGSVSSVGSPAGESKPQRYFFQFNRESVDGSDAVLSVRRKECACESKCPGEAGDILPRAGDGQLQWKTTGHLFSPLE